MRSGILHGQRNVFAQRACPGAHGRRMSIGRSRLGSRPSADAFRWPLRCIIKRDCKSRAAQESSKRVARIGMDPIRLIHDVG